jgi:hypothetical protein
MTQQTISGPTEIRIPSFHHNFVWPPAAANMTMNAVNEAVHFCGQAFLPGRTGSKTLSAGGGGSIWFLPGTVTFANGSTNLRIGLQDLDATGLPMRGDGTFDVYADLVGGTDTITTTTWRQTVMESGTKTVAHGDKISIALELTTYGGADSVIVRGLSTGILTFPGSTLVTAGPTYTADSVTPSALIQFDDGTFGWIDGSFITSTGAMFTNTSVNSGTGTADEWGNIFRVPFPCTAEALFAAVAVTVVGADYELILYSDPLGTPTVVEAISVVGDHIQTATSRLQEFILTTPRPLAANTDYVVAARPTTANSITYTHFDVSTAAHMIAHPFGTDCNLVKRLDNAGAFTETTTSRLYGMGVRVSAFGDDAATGGGGQRIITG